ncbi:MAG TPA: GDP-mannose 4,6-dehydratase [Candidatus Acidoferrales bacterium]|nr:GDP-mannose 4,6-dehydratase [Candidatus Acidoferrales bacterium]
MKILVTGATGFIGSRLLERLAEIGGHDLYSLQRYVTGRYVLGADQGIKVVFCDLRDHFAVKCAIREVQPEVVFHLAAISPVSYSYDHPNEVLDANLTGTVNLAEACLREVPAFKHFLLASTSETFGNGPLPKREDTPQAPNSPYSVSKHAAEKYVLYMSDAYKFPVTVLRPFNTYGRRDNTHFLVERMLVQMLRGDVVKLGDPTPERDLLYVDDHVDAYLTCFAKPQVSIGEVFNFCTGEKLTVKALAEKMRAITAFRGQILWDTIPRRPLDIQILYGDSTKAKSVLGWEARISLDEGLRRTADFWRKKLVGSEQVIRAGKS